MMVLVRNRMRMKVGFGKVRFKTIKAVKCVLVWCQTAVQSKDIRDRSGGREEIRVMGVFLSEGTYMIEIRLTYEPSF